MSSFTENPRAEASRKNGAKSKGPITVAGRAKAAKNALKHGLRADTTILLEGEDKTAFEALEQGLKADLQPVGPLETLLASRLTIAAWRMDRADRIEADLLKPANANRPATLGEKITRDRHGPQAIDCLIRYRGTTQTEFWRALAALRAIQNQKDDGILKTAHERPASTRDVTQPDYIEVEVTEDGVRQKPNEPERR